jgi:hypothetical protein
LRAVRRELIEMKMLVRVVEVHGGREGIHAARFVKGGARAAALENLCRRGRLLLVLIEPSLPEVLREDAA